MLGGHPYVLDCVKSCWRALRRPVDLIERHDDHEPMYEPALTLTPTARLVLRTISVDLYAGAIGVVWKPVRAWGERTYSP